MATSTLHNESVQCDGNGRLARPSAAARIFAQFDRTQLEGFIAVAIDVLDAIDGDSDVEATGDEEEPSGDELDYSVAGWVAGRYGAEDEDLEEDDPAEEDNEDCDGFENEAMFDRRGCARLNRLFGDGPGGGVLLDSDLGALEV